MNRFFGLLGVTLVCISCTASPERPSSASYSGSNATSSELDAAHKAYQERDFEGAARTLKSLAERGDASGQYNLGIFYARGIGVPKNMGKAHELFSLAANQGHIDAQNNLALMYIDGESVSQNYVEAYKWLNVAAGGGNNVARQNLRELLVRMSPEQVAEARRLAEAWTPEVHAP